MGFYFRFSFSFLSTKVKPTLKMVAVGVLILIIVVVVMMAPMMPLIRFTKNYSSCYFKCNYSSNTTHYIISEGMRMLFMVINWLVCIIVSILAIVLDWLG